MSLELLRLFFMEQEGKRVAHGSEEKDLSVESDDEWDGK